MVPTLYGRIQTRIVLTAIIGGLWTLLITPILPTGLPLGPSYRVTFTVLAWVLLLGIVWEFLYHFLQQFRWETEQHLGLLVVLDARTHLARSQ